MYKARAMLLLVICIAFFPRLYDLLMLILQVYSLQVFFLEIMLFISTFLYDIIFT